jgi:hypothetical protein
VSAVSPDRLGLLPSLRAQGLFHNLPNTHPRINFLSPMACISDWRAKSGWKRAEKDSTRVSSFRGVRGRRTGANSLGGGMRMPCILLCIVLNYSYGVRKIGECLGHRGRWEGGNKRTPRRRGSTHQSLYSRRHPSSSPHAATLLIQYKVTTTFLGVVNGFSMYNVQCASSPGPVPPQQVLPAGRRRRVASPSLLLRYLPSTVLALFLTIPRNAEP